MNYSLSLNFDLERQDFLSSNTTWNVKIFSMRKIIYDLVPSMGIEIEHGTMHRLGLKLKVPKCNYKKSWILYQ